MSRTAGEEISPILWASTTFMVGGWTSPSLIFEMAAWGQSTIGKGEGAAVPFVLVRPILTCKLQETDQISLQVLDRGVLGVPSQGSRQGKADEVKSNEDGIQGGGSEVQRTQTTTGRLVTEQRVGHCLVLCFWWGNKVLWCFAGSRSKGETKSLPPCFAFPFPVGWKVCNIHCTRYTGVCSL